MVPHRNLVRKGQTKGCCSQSLTRRGKLELTSEQPFHRRWPSILHPFVVGKKLMVEVDESMEAAQATFYIIFHTIGCRV